MKTIVTHYNPDLDAITAIWLVKKFMKGWESAEVVFVPAGGTYNNEKVDVSDNIIHVDTGFGRFDHHDTDENTCAAKLVWEFIKSQNQISNLKSEDIQMIEAVDRLVNVVNDIDHFREVYWSKPDSDYYDFGLERIIDGWKILYPDKNLLFIEWGQDCLDGMLTTFKNKVWAESEIEKATKFETKWGKGIGFETVNDEVIHLSQKKGYVIVIRKDPRKGYLRIKSLPDKKIDFSDIFEKLREADPDATWFLHVSKHMILNGSAKNPDMRATRLTLEQVIKIIKSDKTQVSK